MHHHGQPLPDADDELTEVGSVGEDNLICPITKQLLVEPMKSTKCGHSYSKEPIMQYMKSRRGRPAKCPVAGCSQLVTVDGLVQDVEAERKLKKRKVIVDDQEEEEDDYTQL